MATASAVKMLQKCRPITVHNIFNHDSTAKVICTFRTISVDGRITTILTAVVGEDALKDDRRYSGFTSTRNVEYRTYHWMAAIVVVFKRFEYTHAVSIDAVFAGHSESISEVHGKWRQLRQ
ncbi:hypothetical protein TNCV_2951661 [Trichonephila clavipes]|nr:hypothetical protein TNCV_2951661 [Trichonephila clavipes]